MESVLNKLEDCSRSHFLCMNQLLLFVQISRIYHFCSAKTLSFGSVCTSSHLHKKTKQNMQVNTGLEVQLLECDRLLNSLFWCNCYSHPP